MNSLIRCSHYALGKQAIPGAARHFASANKPLPFHLRGKRVLVTGVPLLECPTCRKAFPDLELLVKIEEVLEQRFTQGDCRPGYRFDELADDVFAAA